MDLWNAFVNALRNFFNPAISVLLLFFNPLIAISTALVTVISWLLGALSNPQGMMNGIVNKTIDLIASILPSTPDSLKVGSIINNVSGIMPAVGRAVISEIFFSISVIFGLIAAVKLYKLIPFKAT